ncbi:hypothetical protein EJA71_23370 [Pseudomonas sp. PB106]|nr:hypothetical protein EJA71_23370 [Pseudomonas sp. PB106]
MRARSSANLPTVIVPTQSVGMPPVTLCVRHRDAERPWLHSHAERGNDQRSQPSAAPTENCIPM